MTCVLCAAKGRDRELETGHVCPACRHGLRMDLVALIDAAATAGRIPDPLQARTSDTHAAPRSRPPLDLAHIDPELVLVAAVPGDPSSDEPLLVLLESWCRKIREDRGLAPYGIATEGKPVTLTGTVAFLRHHLDWMTTEPTFRIEDFADHVRRGLAALRRLDPAILRATVLRVPCPTVQDATGATHSAERGTAGISGTPPDSQADKVPSSGSALCGYRLGLEAADLHGDVHCPRCGVTWTAQRLLLSALTDPAVIVWADQTTIEDALGIPRRTLSRWADAGQVSRHGSRFDAGQAFRLRHAKAPMVDTA